jgi:Leucine Rich repeat
MAGEEEQWRDILAKTLQESEKSLELNYMSLGDAEAAEIREELVRDRHHSVRELWLLSNNVGDPGAVALSGLLYESEGFPGLEILDLGYNDIGPTGVGALTDAIRHRGATVRELWLGVSPDVVSGSADSEAQRIASLVAAIGVNTTLKRVFVGGFSNQEHQETVNAALADAEGRRSGRERFLAGPVTKAARPRD